MSNAARHPPECAEFWRFFVNLFHPFGTQDLAESELVFEEECRIERNFVPVRQSVARLKTECLRLELFVEVLTGKLSRYAKTVRQPHLYLLREEMVRLAMLKEIAFVRRGREDDTRRQHVRGDKR